MAILLMIVIIMESSTVANTEVVFGFSPVALLLVVVVGDYIVARE